MNLMQTVVRSSCAGALALAALFAAPARAASPAEEALVELEQGYVPKNVVQNRFFYKERRFEIAPVLGAVPNNPFVKRYIGGVLLSYHFNETLAAGGQLLYSPDLGVNDLKDLTITLVRIAHQGDSNVEFQQPYDKMILGSTFSLNWAPVYGKINLVGETVVNFDLYGSAGLGLLVVNKCTAVHEPQSEIQVAESGCTTKPTVPINLAIGADFFLTQSVALKIDARTYLHAGPAPQYNPDVPPARSQLYTDFITTVGVSVFLPKMPPRLTNF